MAGYTGLFLDYRMALWGPGVRQSRDFTDVLDEYTYGSISGTTKLQTAPNTYVPMGVPVVLLRDTDFVAMRRVLSDPTTGAYSFLNVPKEYTYTVMAVDPQLGYRAVLANGVTPT